MMVTPSIFMSKQSPIDNAMVNQPVHVQKAVVVTQDARVAKDVEPKTDTKDCTDVSEVDSSKSAIGSLISEASTSFAKQIAMGASKSIISKNCFTSFQ